MRRHSLPFRKLTIQELEYVVENINFSIKNLLSRLISEQLIKDIIGQGVDTFGVQVRPVQD